MRAALIAVAALGLVAYASAECANACSGHGVCLTSDQCDCFPNFAAADCSQRVCPYGLAWVDNPRGDLDHSGARDSSAVTTYTFTDNNYNTLNDPVTISVSDWETYNPAAQTNEAHFYSECSNKGLCDRASGSCVCFDGYTGSSCQRTTCPNDCSGHGVCRTVDEIAAAGLNKRQVDNRAGVVFNEGMTAKYELYRLWDQDMAQSCVCDPGFSGPDCSRRECPRGDDPLTHRFSDCAGQDCVNEKQIFIIAPTSNDQANWFHIEFTDWTGKVWKTDNFLIGTGSAACITTSLPLAKADSDVQKAIKDALEAIPNSIIPEISVTVAAQSANNPYYVTIEFTKNPGNLPTLKFVNTADMQLNLPKCVALTRQFAAYEYYMTQTVQLDTGAAAYAAGDFTLDLGTYASTTLDTTAVSSGVVTALANPVGHYAEYYTAVLTAGTGSHLGATITVQFFGKKVATPTFVVTVGTGFTNAATITYTVSGLTSYKDGTKELSTCSNRGVCDFDSGLCKCFKGYFGGDCSMQNSLSQ